MDRCGRFLGPETIKIEKNPPRCVSREARYVCVVSLPAFNARFARLFSFEVIDRPLSEVSHTTAAKRPHAGTDESPKKRQKRQAGSDENPKKRKAGAVLISILVNN